MKCNRRNCEETIGVRRFAPGINLCPRHRQAILDASRAYEQRRAVDKKKLDEEAHEIAIQATGWTYPQRYKLTQQGDVIAEFSGGLPSLGKGQ